MGDLLARKAEGRPLAPEEFEVLARFVDRVERRSTVSPTAEKAVVDEIEVARNLIPADAFEMSILDSGLPEHVAYILQEAGFSTLGEMAVQMKVRPDDILRLNGIGPRALQEINNLVAALDERKAPKRLKLRRRKPKLPQWKSSNPRSASKQQPRSKKPKSLSKKPKQ